MTLQSDDKRDETEPDTDRIPVQRTPDQHPGPWPPAGPAMPAPGPPRRRGKMLAVIAAVVVVLAGGATAAALTIGSGARSTGPVAVPDITGVAGTAAQGRLESLGFTVDWSASTGNHSLPVTLQVPTAGSVVDPSETAIVLTTGAGSKPGPQSATTTTAKVLPPPGPPKPITGREWALIARNPDAHVGEAVVVYGQVTQFDAATGTTGFRANVDGVAHKASYGYVDYDTNTILTASSAALLGDLVNRDLFRAEVVVVGAYSYDTQVGGKTTAPQLLVTKIAVTGQAK